MTDLTIGYQKKPIPVIDGVVSALKIVEALIGAGLKTSKVGDTQRQYPRITKIMEISKYPRDMVGYKNNPPNPKWPNGARLAVQFVLNYEEGEKIIYYTVMKHRRLLI